MTAISAGAWRVDLDAKAPPEPRLLALLDAAERKRAAAFARAGDRRAFVRSHAALRLLLSKVLGRPAETIPIGVIEEDGKPKVQAHWLARRSVDLSLSHSAGHALVGIVVGQGQIGVDLEARAAPADYRALAQRHFTADEQRWLLALPPAQQGFRFLQVWTRKEAYLKAIGKGFSRPPSSFRCRLDDAGAVVGTAHDAAGRSLPRWQVVALDTGTVAACAIVDFDATALRVHDFDWKIAATGR
jgi:4'-phosphopantetheinyl transferase